ncbi:hypothetical protein ATO12_12665 [Aquimarina atlantica]|uniref:CAAX prenyl protease 2/Lysostaphin resistance protein A-like domain-containing protein n=1 Tax=Aquimarina atlantica TaxID=1317122 RepID=A0A023BX15_9FLAO|nr:type II CAAX endopeptidase family protein [Aquimarina atlantica]EZH74612.1 hypothetical protein ATO12_12665 [Aquimarina atlantica]
MKQQISDWLMTDRLLIINLIAISTIISYFTGGLGYWFGLLATLLALWSTKFNWADFGITKQPWMQNITYAIWYALGIYVLVDILVNPVIEYFFGIIDLSDLDAIRGNFSIYLITVLAMWVIAAFGEELVYRGYFMKRLAFIFGNSDKAWFLSAMVISIIFGLAHLYQGMSGVISTGIISFIFCLIFFLNRKNLILCMLVHGIYDVMGLTLIYLNKERLIVDWIRHTLLNS